MATLTYKGITLPLQEGQTVLDALLEGGQSMSHACKQGVCQSCLMKTSKGEVPSAAQVGLKETQRQQGYFLSCLCKPEADLDVVACEDQGAKITAPIISVQQLTTSVYALRLKVGPDFIYQAGQYVNLIRPFDQLTRSYSLASSHYTDSSEIELHIKVFPGGEMSNWLSQIKPLETTVDLMGPMGNCFYLPSFKDKNMVLLGYGTGLAPLYGILKEALYHEHSGEIRLYHWGASPEDLYHQEKIQALIQDRPNIICKQGLENGQDPCAMIQEEIASLKDWKIFLCGGEEKVNKARRMFYIAGANLSDIYADAFFTWQAPLSTQKVS